MLWGGSPDTHPPQTARLWLGELLLMAGPLLAFAFLCQLFFTFANDDPFIVFRYADNIRSGLGPVMNAGERVEGFSSPLHLALVTMLREIPLDPLLLAKLMGIAWGLATIAQLLAIGLDHHGRQDLLSYVAPGLLATNAWFALQSVNGLETSLAACMLTAAFARFLREESAAASDWGISGLWAGLASLARPEAPLWILGMAAGWLIASRIAGVNTRPKLWLRRVVWCLSVVGPYLVFRLLYFGEWLPNSYYAKHIQFTDALNLGIRYILPFLAVNMGLASLALLPWTIWRADSRTQQIGGSVFGCLAAELGFLLLTGGDWMQGFRFIIPVMPILFLGLQEGWRQILLRSPHGPCPAAPSPPTGARGTVGSLLVKRAVPWLLIIGLAFPTLFHDVYQIRSSAVARSWREAHWSLNYRHLLTTPYFRSLFAISDSLSALASPGELVAIGEAGVIPFEHPDLRFVDEHGLTDRTIARMKVPRYLIGPQADYTDLTSPIARHILHLRPALILRGTNRWADECARTHLPEPYILAYAMRIDSPGPDTGFILWRVTPQHASQPSLQRLDLTPDFGVGDRPPPVP